MSEKKIKIRREFTMEFKKQVVDLYNQGKRKVDIQNEYQLGSSTLNRWIKQYNTTGAFTEKANRSELECELIELKKRNKWLEMENDILKQVALMLEQS